jgi:hypothetical protein
VFHSMVLKGWKGFPKGMKSKFHVRILDGFETFQQVRIPWIG